MKHKIMVLGTFHMAGSIDLHGEKQEGVFSEKSQKELAELRALLAGFQPTQIAVECEKTENAWLNDQYKAYLDGKFDLTENEIHQIAFPLAKQLNLSEVHAVDWMEQGVGLRGCGDVCEYLERKEPELFAELSVWEEKSLQGKEDASILERIRILNSPEMETATKAYYVNYARIGVEDDYYGLGWLMWWYQRNLIQFANLSQLVSKEREERVLFLVGNAHKGIISNFLRESQLFEVVDTLDYLGS